MSSPVDTEMSNAPFIALPLAIALLIAAIPRAWVISKSVSTWYAFMVRAPGNVTPGPGFFEVETIGDEPTNLGHSSETLATPSGTPTLVGEPVVLQIIGGPKLRLATGANITITSLAGAKRRTVDTTTTETGVTDKITFAVPPQTRFWLECVLTVPAGGDANTAYRSEQILETTPLGNYTVEATRPAPPTMMPAVIGYAIGAAVVGLVIGFVTSMLWRTGFRSGRYDIPFAALADALSVTSVFAMLGVHVGAASVIPDSSLKMREKEDGTFVVR